MSFSLHGINKAALLEGVIIFSSCGVKACDFFVVVVVVDLPVGRQS